MWIVRLALRRPYTFAVAALLILILGVLSILSMPTDIFPNIDIPVVTVVWGYNGLSAEQMANRVTTPVERGLTTTVSDIDHMESQSYSGMTVIKIFFKPHVNIASALAQVTATNQVMLRSMPTGMTPPFIIQYNASSVPILQLGLSGHGLTEQRLNDLAMNVLRAELTTVEGIQLPYPYGGKSRQIMVDLDLPALTARGLSPSDVVTAIGNQNVIAPSGTAKLDRFEYAVETNSTPGVVAELNNLPIKTANGAIIYVHDVAHVRDGNAPQTNIVHVNGQRSTLMTVMKTGSVSTLDIVREVKEKLLIAKLRLPPEMRIDALADQSLYVRSAVSGVVREAIIAACLTAIMILVFLGSWRSTVIIAVSIPLSILCSITALWVLGETINIMTLGGLALAVGILVDDATVAIENINRFLEEGHELEQSILDGSAQISIPALVSTLSICIVFVPMFFLSGVAKYLFVPMAEAVVFAMLASYALSRTVVPTMAKYLLKEHDDAEAEARQISRNPFVAFQRGFEAGFNNLRDGYLALLTLAVDHAKVFLCVFLLFALGSVALLAPWLGQDFFPSVDSGSFILHVRAHTGTRVEETAALCEQIEGTIRQEIPPSEMKTIVDNIGMPSSGLALSYSTSAPVGTADADIQVELNEKHHSTDAYVRQLRKVLAEKYPGVTFYALPVDIVTQILNFGLAAPIDIQIVGPNMTGNRALAQKILNDIRYVPGAADTRIQQPDNMPMMRVNVDRTRAQAIGLTEKDVTQSLLVSLSGSFQTTPNYYLSPTNGVTYSIVTQAPQYNTNSLSALKALPLPATTTTASTAPRVAAPGASTPAQIVGNVATIQPDNELGLVSHYNVQPVIDIYSNVDNTDLGSVSSKIQKILDKYKSQLPRGSEFIMRGQSLTMRSSYIGLLAGLAFSILLVYLLIVVNFQSWLDPFLIISALPAALAGIVWMLFLTHTHLSVPALTGSIMCMGVATANSILVVSFAREQLEELVGDARQAALNAGFVRLRPVLMTALAMIIGMIPMALGLGDGGEQNAPLGRAVIGGLLLATIATLFFVPSFFSLVHGWLERHRRQARKNPHTASLDEFDEISE